MQPQEAAILLKMTVHALEHEHGVTKKVIEAIPPAKSGYRPDPISKTALELAWHIVSAEIVMLDGVASGAVDWAAEQRPESVKTPADIIAWYDAKFPATLQKLNAVTGDDLVKMIDFGPVQFPRIAVARIAMNHTIHHRGQLSVYLRPMGATVPSIYGPGYAEEQAMAAAKK